LMETIMGQFVGPEVVDNDDGDGDKKAAPAKEKKDKERHPVDIRLCDFDDVAYRITIEKDERHILLVSMNAPSYRDIKDQADGAIKAAFGDLVRAPVQGQDITVAINLDTLPEEKREDTAKHLALMKSIAIGSIFKDFYTKLAKDEVSQPFKFDLRRDTTVYFVSDKDRVTTIFGLDFFEKVDKVLAKVFMQEFVDAKRRFGFAPTVAFSVAPPAELAKFGITEPTGNLGFISFGVLKSHVASAALIDRVVLVMQSFRNYIQYHIKCSKSYFHSRMRARAVSLLKVLNRARVEDPEKDKTKGKKTISGKTFKRVAAEKD